MRFALSLRRLERNIVVLCVSILIISRLKYFINIVVAGANVRTFTPSARIIHIIVIVSPTTAVLFCVHALSFSAVASRFNLGNKSSTSFFFYIPRSSLTSPPSPRRSQFLTRHPARENKTQRTVVPEQSCWSTCSNGTC